jgi:hypothetical protein
MKHSYKKNLLKDLSSLTFFTKIISDKFTTKIINTPKSDISQRENIAINKEKLLKIELDDLLK